MISRTITIPAMTVCMHSHCTSIKLNDFSVWVPSHPGSIYVTFNASYSSVFRSHLRLVTQRALSSRIYTASSPCSAVIAFVLFITLTIQWMLKYRCYLLSFTFSVILWWPCWFSSSSARCGSFATFINDKTTFPWLIMVRQRTLHTGIVRGAQTTKPVHKKNHFITCVIPDEWQSHDCAKF